MNIGNFTKVSSAALFRAALIGLGGAFLMGFMVVTTVTSSSLGTGSIKLGNEGFTSDATVTLNGLGAQLGTTTAGALGGASPGEEATTPLGPVNNSLTAGNYVYKFEVKETLSGDWTGSPNEIYRIEVYGDNVLLTTLFTTQSTAVGTVEGVVVTVDVGSSTTIPDEFDVIVTKTQ